MSLAKYPSDERTHLDVACGTGLAVEFFEKHGYQSVGWTPRWPCWPWKKTRRAPGRRRFPLAPVPHDVQPHHVPVRQPQSHRAARRSRGRFRQRPRAHVARSLFLFDMNHPDVYPAVWGMHEPYVSTGRDHHLEIATKYRARDGIAHGLVTGWARLPNGEQVKIRETHRQRAWSQAEIAECLGEAGLSALEVIDFDPFQDVTNLDTGGVKLFFVCRAGRRFEDQSRTAEARRRRRERRRLVAAFFRALCETSAPLRFASRLSCPRCLRPVPSIAAPSRMRRGWNTETPPRVKLYSSDELPCAASRSAGCTSTRRLPSRRWPR